MPRLKLTWSLLIIVLALPLQMYFGLSAVEGALRVYQHQRDIAAVQADLARLGQRRQELEEQRLYLQSDHYVERVAREELNLIKPGDQPVAIVPGSRPSLAVSSAPPPPARPETPDGVKNVIHQLFNRFLGSGESTSPPSGRP